jgi:transposase
VAAAEARGALPPWVPATTQPALTREPQWIAGLRLPAAAREQLDLARQIIDALDTQLVPFDSELPAIARKQPGCRALIDQIYGVGDLTAVTILAELGDVRRFRNSRDVVRYGGLDITVYQSDAHRAPASSPAKDRPRCAGRCMRQRARLPASPDRPYYRQLAARIGGNRACLARANCSNQPDEPRPGSRRDCCRPTQMGTGPKD